MKNSAAWLRLLDSKNDRFWPLAVKKNNKRLDSECTGNEILNPKIKWKDVAEIIGVVAVVVSLLIVAVEIRQNNELMVAQDRYNRLSVLTSLQDHPIENLALREAMIKYFQGAELSNQEDFMVEMFWRQNFTVVEWTFKELELAELPLEGWRDTWSSPGVLDKWNENKFRYSSEFVNFIDTNIVAE